MTGGPDGPTRPFRALTERHGEAEQHAGGRGSGARTAQRGPAPVRRGPRIVTDPPPPRRSVRGVQVTVLGTSVGVPLGAPCSGYLVRSGRTRVLLDCGPGVAGTLWQHDVLGRLDAVVLSHAHADHLWDLPLLASGVARMAVQRRHGARPRARLILPSPGTRAVLDALATAVGWDPAALEEVFAVEEPALDTPVDVGDLELRFAPTLHPVPCAAIRVDGPAASLAYGADGEASDELTALCRDADLALLEATFVDDGPLRGRHGHMTGEQAANVARDAAVRRLLLTHVQPWSEDHAENLRRASAVLPGRVGLAQAGRTYPVGTAAPRPVRAA